MRAKVEEREKARALRAEGLSLAKIAVRLGVSKSSVSLWVRDLPPPARATPLQLEIVVVSGDHRICGNCGEDLPIEAFNRHKEGHQWWCRECFRSYFKDRGELHRLQVKASVRRRRAIAREFVASYLDEHPCVDCREGDPAVLDFDHLRDKLREVPRLANAGASLARIADEIDRCQVVCANCHRRRTAQRAGWRRLNPDALTGLERTVARNVAFMYNDLRASGCRDCGERDLCVLEFDHIGVKTESVSRLAYNGVSIKRLRQEILHCQVCCANCHRRRTCQRREAAEKAA